MGVCYLVFSVPKQKRDPSGNPVLGLPQVVSLISHILAPYIFRQGLNLWYFHMYNNIVISVALDSEPTDNLPHATEIQRRQQQVLECKDVCVIRRSHVHLCPDDDNCLLIRRHLIRERALPNFIIYSRDAIAICEMLCVRRLRDRRGQSDN